MLRYHQWRDIDRRGRGASVAIGNFDGVHRGHQAVIATAAARPGPLGVLTFEPHPRQYFAPGAPAFRLMNAEARAHRLEKLGVSRLYELPFNQRLAAMTAAEFVDDILAGGLGLSHATIGADFRFGRGREGRAQDLLALCARHRIGVSVVDLLGEGGDEISSTAIRAALSAGQPHAARAMLGHWHRIEGPVIHGEHRGRDLGFPTANLALSGLHLPKLGIYAVTVEVLGGIHQGSYGGAASLGVRPMFGENSPNLEIHLLDFEGDLYDQTLSVGLVAYLRPEQKFSSLEALTARMALDCHAARAELSAL